MQLHFPDSIRSWAVVSVFLLGLGGSTFAQTTTTWTGSVSQDWSIPGNWSAGVPDATKIALLNNNTLAVPYLGSTTDVLDVTLTPGVTFQMATGSLLRIHRTGVFNGTVTGDGFGIATIRLTGTTTVCTLQGSSALPLVDIDTNGFPAVLSGQLIIGALTLTSGALSISNPGTVIHVAGNAHFDGGTLANGGGVLDVMGNIIFASGGTACTAPPAIRCGGTLFTSDSFVAASGTITFYGLVTGLASISYSEIYLHDVVIESGAFSTAATVHASSILVQNAGTMNVGATKLHVPTLTVAGTLSIPGRLYLGSTSSVHVTAAGTLTIGGSATVPAGIEGLCAPGWQLLIDGTLSASFFVFKGMGAAGVVVSQGAFVLGLQNGLFDSPITTPGATLLDIQQATPHTFLGLGFRNGPHPAGTFGVKSLGGATITIGQYSGNRAGPAFTNAAANHVVWAGAAGGVLANFSTSQSPAGTLISWTFSSSLGVISYDLERSLDGGPFVGFSQFVPNSSPGYLDGSLLQGQSAMYQLRANLASGLRKITGTTSAGPAPVTPPPNVLYVGGFLNPGGQSADYANIQDAVWDASLPNTVIKVGMNSPGFSITSVPPGGLRIMPNSMTPNIVIQPDCTPVSISNLGPLDVVEISDIGFYPGPVSLVISNCAGPVLIDEMSAAASPTTPTVSIINSPAVSITRAYVQGIVSVSGSSHVCLSHGNTIETLSVTGGATVTSVQNTIFNTVTSGGGVVTTLPNLMPAIDAPEPAPLGVSFDITLTAQPNSPFLLAYAATNAFIEFPPLFEMPLLLDPATLTIALTGTTGPSLTTLIPVTLPLNSVFQGLPIPIQFAAADPITGVLRMSNAMTIIGGP